MNSRNSGRLSSLWPAAVIVLLVVAGVAAFFIIGRGGDDPPPAEVPGAAHTDDGSATEAPPEVVKVTKEPVPGVDVPFEVKEAYIDPETRRIINPNDCDGDGLSDDWEMKRFGTLKYHAGNYATAPRIDIAAARTDPDDTDGDGLPDVWERKSFGNLAANASDDLDADGFDNLTEYRLGQNPTKPDVVDQKLRPRVLLRRTVENPNVGLFETEEFWASQDKLRGNATTDNHLSGDERGGNPDAVPHAEKTATTSAASEE